MPMKSNSKTLAPYVILAAALSIPTGSGAVQDQPENKIPGYTAGIADYNFLIASGFLCDPDHFHDCPAVAQTANGESIEIEGAGTLNVANKSVIGAGAFTERTRMGETVTTGSSLRVIGNVNPHPSNAPKLFQVKIQSLGQHASSQAVEK